MLAEVTVMARRQLLGEAPQCAVHNPPVAPKVASVSNVDLRSAHPLEAHVLRRDVQDEPETRRSTPYPGHIPDEDEQLGASSLQQHRISVSKIVGPRSRGSKAKSADRVDWHASPAVGD